MPYPFIRHAFFQEGRSMQYATRSAAPARRKLALAVAFAISIGGAGSALAQSNATGAIYGSATPGDIVHIENTDNGLRRDITVDSGGRYRANSLPIGTYTVSLMHNGTAVDPHKGVQPQISQGTAVSFAATAAAAGAADTTNLGSVQVTANTLPSIDV